MSRKPSRKTASFIEQDHHNLAIASQADGLLQDIKRLFAKEMDATAEPLLDLLLMLDPVNAEALYFQGRRQAEKGNVDHAINSLTTASYQLPDRPGLYWLLAKLYTLKQQDRGAISALQRFLSLRHDDKDAIWHLAALYSANGYTDHAEHWLRRAIRTNPASLAANTEQKRLSVLVLKTARETIWNILRKEFTPVMTEGHNNLWSLMDGKNIAFSQLYVDDIRERPEILRQLPKIDLVYNGITDAERCAEALEKAAWVCQRLQRPVINPPEQVLAASREGNYARFKDACAIILPRSIKLEHVQGECREIVEAAMAEHGLKLPLIVRLAGFQGGKFMHKVHDLANHDLSDIDRELAKKPQTLYLIQYHAVDYRDERAPATTFYPKYRAFLVGGQLYPVHLFTADGFNVHKKNADPIMEVNPWLIDKERDYCQNPAAHLGEAKWEALAEAMQQTGLDYTGVDFAPATAPEDEGKLIVFELNPAMRNWVNQLPEGDHVQEAWRVITVAAHEHFAAKAGIEPWAFNIPRGQGESLRLPEEISFREKVKAADHQAENQQWLASRLGESNDFSDAPFFDLKHYIDEELLAHEVNEGGITLQRRPSRMLEFTQGDKQVVFHINAPRVPVDVHLMERDKLLVKELLRRHGLPTPKGEAFSEFQAAYRYFAQCERPQVVKPSNGFASRGVTVNVTTPEQFRDAWQKAKKIGQTILIEEMIQGEELRVYFIGGQFVAATARVAPFVLGDGKHSVTDLLESKNHERRHNPSTAKYPIAIQGDRDKTATLLSSIPEKDEWVQLGESHMASQGAEYILLDKLPASLIEACAKASQLLPSQVCGVDIFIESLSTPECFWITEINASTPAFGYQFHFPRYGSPKPIASSLLNHAIKHLGLHATPQAGEVMPAKPCQPVTSPQPHFATDMLQMVACAYNLPCQRLDDYQNALLLGSPARLGWIEGVSTHTALESVQILKHPDWLQTRLQEFDVPSDEPTNGTEVRVLMAGNRLLAAHARLNDGWQDVSESLHSGVADVAARAMQAIYTPGHALLTLSLVDFTAHPESTEWSLMFVDLQPDLSFFYSNIDRPRDVIPALLSVWWPGYEQELRDPMVQRLYITGHWENTYMNPVDWLRQQMDLHVLNGHCQQLETGQWDVQLQGQPNAITAFIGHCRHTNFIETVEVIDPELEDTTANGDILTLRLVISGKVQGVGYRQWFVDQLKHRGIPGWVRNLPDGSVEAVIHGSLDTLQPFCDEVPNGPEHANVTSLDMQPWGGDIPSRIAILDTSSDHK